MDILKTADPDIYQAIANEARRLIEVDRISVATRFFDGLCDRHSRTFLARSFKHSRIRLIAGRTREGKRERKLTRRIDPRIHHIIAVTDKGDVQAIKLPTLFNQR